MAFKGFTVRDILDIAAGRELSDTELKGLLGKVEAVKSSDIVGETTNSADMFGDTVAHSKRFVFTAIFWALPTNGINANINHMKFLKLSAALAVASCLMINSIAQATVKEKHELSGAKPTVKNEKVVSKSKAPAQIEKKLSKTKGSVPNQKEASKNKKEAFKIEAKLDTKKAQEKVKPVKKEFWRGMELPANYKQISILGDAVATKGQAVNLIKQNNPKVKLECDVEEIVAFYWAEAQREGVRPDIALAQALVETGYFGFGGTVKPKQNNFCGLGTTGKKVKGAKFKTPELGVRAHIQHLLAYSAKKKPSTKIVDPRYELAHAIRSERGFVDKWSGLQGTWAMGSNYCEKIMVIYQAMLGMEMSEAEKKELLARQKLEQEQREARLKNDKKYRKQMEKEAKEREKARKKAEKEAKKRKQKEAEHKRHERVDKVVREDKDKDK